MVGRVLALVLAVALVGALVLVLAVALVHHFSITWEPFFNHKMRFMHTLGAEIGTPQSLESY